MTPSASHSWAGFLIGGAFGLAAMLVPRPVGVTTLVAFVALPFAERAWVFPNRWWGSRQPAPESAAYSHSMVPGGLLVTSTTTRLISRTSLVMRVEMRSITS